MKIKLQPRKPQLALNSYPTATSRYEIHFEGGIPYADRLETNPCVIKHHGKGII